MAKISTYPVDSTISDSDIVIGSDGDNAYATKNYTVGALSTYVQAPLKNQKVVGVLFPVDTGDASRPLFPSKGESSTSPNTAISSFRSSSPPKSSFNISSGRSPISNNIPVAEGDISESTCPSKANSYNIEPLKVT